MRAVVNSVGLNLRSEPQMGDNVVDQLSRGDAMIVEYMDLAKRWFHVTVERTGERGWVYALYADLKCDPPPPAPEPLPPVPHVEPQENKRQWVKAICLALASLILFAAWWMLR